tara:strand:+ start:38 stop:505 length:468 start_codon:yes stop_codon:yes gene_type:complete
MDKTTTWLVRGASAIVIIFGIGYLAKPQIIKLANVIEKKEYKNEEWSKKYSRNPKSYCEKLVGKHLNKNVRVLLALNVDLESNADALFDYCEEEGGSRMSKLSKCMINAQYLDYSKKELNKIAKLYKSDRDSAGKFTEELVKSKELKCNKFSEEN